MICCLRASRRALTRACASRRTRARSSGVCAGTGGGAAGAWAGCCCVVDCDESACAWAEREISRHGEIRKREKTKRRALALRRSPEPTGLYASTTRLPLLDHEGTATSERDPN